jgi:hypothetical protein
MCYDCLVPAEELQAIENAKINLILDDGPISLTSIPASAEVDQPPIKCRWFMSKLLNTVLLAQKVTVSPRLAADINFCFTN